MSDISFRDMLEGYEGKWVAMSDDEEKVIAASDSFSEARGQALAKGERNPVMLKVPPKDASYVL